MSEKALDFYCGVVILLCFLLFLDAVMTPELILVTDIKIHTNYCKGHCAPFLFDKTELFFKMGIDRTPA